MILHCYKLQMPLTLYGKDACLFSELEDRLCILYQLNFAMNYAYKIIQCTTFIKHYSCVTLCFSLSTVCIEY